MNELNQNLEALIDKFSNEDTNLCLENRFPYLYTKAYYFIKDGAEAYASSDAFKLPDSSFNGEDLELLKLGCNQLLEGRGFSSKNPFTNLGIRGCHKLFELFHFEFVNQTATKVDGGMLDKMTFKHVMDKREINYYNLV